MKQTWINVPHDCYPSYIRGERILQTGDNGNLKVLKSEPGKLTVRRWYWFDTIWQKITQTHHWRQ